MDCLVWASSKAVTPEDEVPVSNTREVDGPIDEQEKERIRVANLEESDESAENKDDAAEDNSSEVDSDNELPTTEFWDRNLSRISKEQEKAPRQSLKERQLALIGAEVRNVREEAERDQHDMERRFLEETRRRWVNLGMMKEEDAHLLNKIGGPYHENIKRTRDEYFKRKRQEETTELKEMARRFYEDEWVTQKEEELMALQKQEDSATGEETRKALQYMISVAQDALKMNFKKIEVPGLAKLVLEERRRKCVEMGWASSQQIHSISTIWEPLPYPCEAEPHCEEDEEEMFITPEPIRRSEEIDILGNHTSSMMTPTRQVDMVFEEPPPTPSWSPRPAATMATPLRTTAEEEEFDLNTPPPTPSFITQSRMARPQASKKRKRKSKKASGQKRMTQYFPSSQP